ncbi:MAG: GNAT family N-acetyltransferase [Pseudomonadota bacterium]
MKIRAAVADDAAQISAFLQELTALGKRTRPSDEAFVRAEYIGNPNGVSCTVAEDADGTLLGIQILSVAQHANPYGVAPGWGIIGTHGRPSAARRGVGRALFPASRAAAEAAGLASLDAAIGETNAEGLAYYEAMGFRTYRTYDGRICKRYDISGKNGSGDAR